MKPDGSHRDDGVASRNVFVCVRLSVTPQVVCVAPVWQGIESCLRGSRPRRRVLRLQASDVGVFSSISPPSPQPAAFLLTAKHNSSQTVRTVPSYYNGVRDQSKAASC